MMTSPHTSAHPASVDAYIRHGWALVPIPPGSKGPLTKDWNKPDQCIKSQDELRNGFGIGLCHAYSGTMALDIDDWHAAATLLSLHGIDLKALYEAPDAVIIDSGREGHGKLLYRVSEPLPSKKLITVGKDGLPFNFLDFRCSTMNGLTVQDVLPPTIHPLTMQPYRWAGNGHWSRLPEIPAPLLALWRSLLDGDKRRSIDTSEPLSATWEEIQDALSHCDPDCSRSEWIDIGMALHWAGAQTQLLDQALYLWDQWSQGSVTKYPGQHQMLAQWRSFRADKAVAVKIGSLFRLATRWGWKRPEPDASELFSAVTPEAPENLWTDWIRPAPPAPNLDLWPPVMVARAQEIAETRSCDVLVPLWSGMACVAACADARTRLELFPGFRVPPVLWIMLIGSPANKKTPGSVPMREILDTMEREDLPRWKAAMLEWEAYNAAHAAGLKDFREAAASGEFIANGSNVLPRVIDCPAQPQPLRLTVNDITSAKLVRHAAHRPEGFLCWQDEMGAWIRKMTSVTNTEDRSVWTQAYESRPYHMDRQIDGTTSCENLAVSVFGNIQPKLYTEHKKTLAIDGLLQRFIPITLRSTRGIGDPRPEITTGAWDNAMRLVRALPQTTYKLSPEAFTVFRTFQHWYDQKRHDEELLGSDATYMEAFGKLEGLCGRIMLLWHMMEAPFSSMVSAAIAQRAADLVQTFIVPSLRYALVDTFGIEDGNMRQWMREYIVQSSGEISTITLSYIRRAARRFVEGLPQWQAELKIMDAMDTLEESGWVLKIHHDWQRHSVTWAINPGLAKMFEDYRLNVLKAKQRERDFIYRLGYERGTPRKIVRGFDPETMGD